MTLPHPGHKIKDAIGNLLPQRVLLKFTGTGVSVTDDSSTGTTLVTVNGGSSTWTVVSKTANYTAGYGELIKCNISGGGFTVTLPTAVGHSGESICVRLSSTLGATLTIATTSSQTINGVTTRTLVNLYEEIIVTSDGTNWLATTDNTDSFG